LDIGDAKQILRIRHRLVEQEIGATVGKDRQQAELFGNRAERRRISARDDAGEHIDVFGELHAAKLLDIGIGAGGLIGSYGHDLAFAKQAALGVYLFGSEVVAFYRGLAEHRRRSAQEGHVTDLKGRIRNLPFSGLCGFEQRRSGHRAGPYEAGTADGDAELIKKVAPIDIAGLVHSPSPVPPGSGAPATA